MPRPICPKCNSPRVRCHRNGEQSCNMCGQTWTPDLAVYENRPAPKPYRTGLTAAMRRLKRPGQSIQGFYRQRSVSGTAQTLGIKVTTRRMPDLSLMIWRLE